MGEATNRMAGADAALDMAANKNAAAQHAKIFIAKWKGNGPDLSGGNACRKIGVFRSDHPMQK